MSIREMKDVAKNRMKASSPKAIWVSLIYLLILPIACGSSAGILGLIINFGFSIYALNISRMRPAGVETLFDGFYVFFRALWLSICHGFMVFVWCLPVVAIGAIVGFLCWDSSSDFPVLIIGLFPWLMSIPCIIANLQYSMASYILIDHPEWSAIRCMRESSMLMKGKKWDLFVLDLSFIGWIILTLVPFVCIYVLPYIQITHSVFYNQLLNEGTSAEVKQMISRETIGISTQMVVLSETGVLAGQHRISTGRITIGRDASCDFQFPTNTSGVSKHHCEIQLTGSGIVLTDLGSSYGTFLENGRKLEPNMPINLGCEGRFYLASPMMTFAVQILR